MGAIATLVVVLGIVGVIYGLMERAKAKRVTGAPLLETGEIRSQAGGSAVSVEGSVVCQEPLIAPFSGTPCLYYSIKCTAEWKAGDTKKTKVLSSTRSAAKFSIDDGSGPVGIDAAEGGTFEPTQEKSETKGAGLMGGITGKELMFGRYAVSTGALEVGTEYRVDEEVLPLEPRLYACGAANGAVIGPPSGMRSLILSHKSRDDLLGSALKTSKAALSAGFGGIAAGTVLGVISRLVAPSADASSPNVSAGAVPVGTPAAEMAAAPATPPAPTATPAGEPAVPAHVATQHRLHEPGHPEIKPAAAAAGVKIETPGFIPAQSGARPSSSGVNAK